MSARSAGLAFLAVLLASCGGSRPYGNVTEYRASTGATLVVIRRQWDDRVAYLDGEDRLVLLERELAIRGTIEDILWSPSGTRCLIESYGEGDQGIAVYDWATIRAAGESGGDGSTAPAWRSLDPYLHGLRDIAWIDDGHLRFRSTGDFDRFDRESRRAEYVVSDDRPEHLRSWIWDLERDEFRAAGR
jgi:hypothetical protein